MFYSSDEVLQYVQENDVKFIRLAFCDICGTLKNVAIMPSQLERALDEGITLDPRSLRGFNAAGGYDLLLRPDPSTLTAMPWRPQQGRVVRQPSCSTSIPRSCPVSICSPVSRWRKRTSPPRRQMRGRRAWTTSTRRSVPTWGLAS